MTFNETMFYIAVFLFYLLVLQVTINFMRKKTLKKLLKNYDVEKDTSRRVGEPKRNSRTVEGEDGSNGKTKSVSSGLRESEGRELLPPTDSNRVELDKTGVKKSRKGFFRRRKQWVKMKWYDWVTIFSLFIIVIAIIIGTAAYYKDEVNQCTAQPLVYGAKQMENLYGFESIGTLYLLHPINKATAIFVFNSHNITKRQWLILEIFYKSDITKLN